MKTTLGEEFPNVQHANNTQSLRIPNCDEYPLDAKANMNMQSSIEISLSRIQDSTNKGVTENISSGFGSGHDATDSDFDMVNVITNGSNCIQSMKPNLNYQNQISNVVFPFTENSSCISPNLLSFKNCELNAKSFNESKIDETSKNYNSLIWDLDPSFNLSDLENMPKLNQNNDIFNLDDMINISELQNANQHIFQKCLFEDQALNSQFEKIDFNNQENFMFQQQDPFLNQNQLDLNGIQNILTDSTIRVGNEGVANQIIDDTYNDPLMRNLNQILPNMQAYQNLNIPNMNCAQQNVIVRVFQNGQFHLASIDQNVLQQMINNNTRNNINVINNNQIEQQSSRNVLNSNDSLMHKNFAQSVIQKSPETFDLMENPTNWRRIPNNGGYQCNICNKCYTRKYGLKIHLRIHSGFKPLECKVCKKKFGDPSNMAKHIRLHSTEGSPYKCNLCNKPLVRRRDLERHMRSRHPDSVIRANVDITRRN